MDSTPDAERCGMGSAESVASSHASHNARPMSHASLWTHVAHCFTWSSYAA
jgi:hypothetical protein